MTLVSTPTNIMLLQLHNIISNYSTNIIDINIDYHHKYEYLCLGIKCLICKTTGKIYNYRNLSGTYPAYVRDKNLCYITELPKNYV